MSFLGAGLYPSKCPRKPVPYQATNGSCPVTDPTLMTVSCDTTTYIGPTAPFQPLSGLWGPIHYSSNSSLSCLPPPCAFIIMALLQIPQDTGRSLRRGPVPASHSLTVRKLWGGDGKPQVLHGCQKARRSRLLPVPRWRLGPCAELPRDHSGTAWHGSSG